jgi:hypothetical protein
VPAGVKALGVASSGLWDLLEGTSNLHRVTKLIPGLDMEVPRAEMRVSARTLCTGVRPKEIPEGIVMVRFLPKEQNRDRTENMDHVERGSKDRSGTCWSDKKRGSV